MRKSTHFAYALILIFIFFSKCKKEEQITTERSLGLIKTPEAELFNMPVAEPLTYTGSFPEQFYLETPPPEEKGQGLEGSCVGWALAYGMKSYHLGQSYYDPSGNFDYSSVCSPEYIYNQIKVSDCKSGAYFYDAFELLKKQGVCTWDIMPYSDNNGCSTMPDFAQTENAGLHKILSYKRVNDLSEKNIKILLLNKYPVVIGAKLDDNFMRADKNFIWHEPFGTFRGNHAMVICGYDDKKQAFKIINSWGRDFGDNGYIWCDYNFIKEVVFEAYITEPDENGDNPEPTEDLIAHFEFNGNYDDITNKNIVFIQNYNDLVITNSYLSLKNSYDGDPQRNLKFKIEKGEYDKIEIESKSYYIHNGGYTISGFNYAFDNNSLYLSHNDYHYSGSNEVGQYDLREHIYLLFVERDYSNNPIDWSYSDLLPLVENEWVTEKITVDFKNNTAYYTLITASGTYNISLSSIDLKFSNEGEFLFSAWDWADGSELRIDDLKIYGYSK